MKTGGPCVLGGCARVLVGVLATLATAVAARADTSGASPATGAQPADGLDAATTVGGTELHFAARRIVQKEIAGASRPAKATGNDLQGAAPACQQRPTGGQAGQGVRLDRDDVALAVRAKELHIPGCPIVEQQIGQAAVAELASDDAQRLAPVAKQRADGYQAAVAAEGVKLRFARRRIVEQGIRRLRCAERTRNDALFDV